MAIKSGAIIRLAGLVLLRLVAIALVVLTLFSVTDLNAWWIRIWDFPRLQIAVLMLLVLIAVIAWDRRWRWPLGAVLLCAFGYQSWRIAPYTPVWPIEVARVAEDAQGNCFSLVTFNVLQDNRDFEATGAMLRRMDPDIVLLLETDDGWANWAEEALAAYPAHYEQPLENKYGLYFATRLPVRDAEIRNLAEEDTPSLTATVTKGFDFRLYALHPRPPVPGQDTDERDAEIVMAAREVREQDLPAMAIGDFNDVAWSDTSQLFQRTGRFLDPRIGRGPHSTFPSAYPWLAWPLDHLFLTEEFTLVRMEVMEDVGSDHRPLYAELCLEGAEGDRINEEPDPRTEADAEQEDEILEEYRTDREEG